MTCRGRAHHHEVSRHGPAWGTFAVKMIHGTCASAHRAFIVWRRPPLWKVSTAILSAAYVKALVCHGENNLEMLNGLIFSQRPRPNQDKCRDHLEILYIPTVCKPRAGDVV